MSDYTAEAEARLEKYPQAGGGTSEQHEADIRAALAMIERRGPHPDDLGILRDAAGLSARCAELRDRLVAQGKRAEAAEHQNVELTKALAAYEAQVCGLEAKLAEAHELGSVKSALSLRAERQELVKTKLTLQAEVERLREALNAVMPGLDDYWSQIPEGMAAIENARAALRGGGG